MQQLQWNNRMLNTKLQNVLLGNNNVSRIMLGDDLVWPLSPSLIFKVTNASEPLNVEINTPAEFLIFQIEGGGATLHSTPKSSVTNKTLSTIAHGTSGLYTETHKIPNFNALNTVNVEANFNAALTIQILSTRTRVRTSNYTTTDLAYGRLYFRYTNEYSIDVTFQVEIKNSSGAVIYNSAITTVRNSNSTNIIASGLTAGNYAVKVTNNTTGSIYETTANVSTTKRGYQYYTINIDLNAESPGLFEKLISVYPTTRDKAYNAFYGTVAVIEILAYNVKGSAYTQRDIGPFGYRGSGAGVPPFTHEGTGAAIILAKLVSGGSGYRANAFYPIFYNDVELDDDGTYVEFGGNIDDGQEIVPIFVALTDSTGSVTQLVEYDEQKYGYRLYNDRNSGAGMHWLHFHSTYYSISYGYSSAMGNWAPQYVTYLHPVTGEHLTDSVWVNDNLMINQLDYYNYGTNTLDDPFAETGGADIVAILGNISGRYVYYGDNPFDERISAEFIYGPTDFHTLDPEANWWEVPQLQPSNPQYPGYGRTSLIGDNVDPELQYTHDSSYWYGSQAPGLGGFDNLPGDPNDGYPWRDSLGGPGTGSPVYKKYNFEKRRHDNYFRINNNQNLSTKSIEFVNISGKGPPAIQPADFVPNTLVDDPDVQGTFKVDFGNTLISGVTAESQTKLKILKGADLDQSTDPSSIIDSKLDITPNSLDAVYSRDIAFTDVKEYCVLEIGAIIPAFAIHDLGTLLRTHPGEHPTLSLPLLTTINDTSTNFSLYTFYIRLKAKGSGYPPNSKIPVYVRRGSHHVQNYDSSLLPNNPGPTLEYGHVSDITVNGRGSGGPCICMIHTDGNGITTHITEYVDPKSKCQSEGASSSYPTGTNAGLLGVQLENYTADHIDGANYDGTESPLMTTSNNSTWYRERPSQYRRLMNFGEVSDSIYGYAKDYIAPVDLVDNTDWGKAKWTGNSNDYVSKAYNFGCIARYKQASIFEMQQQDIDIRYTRDDFGRAAYELGTDWDKIIGNNDFFHVNERPYFATANDSRYHLWQSFRAWETFRDVYVAKGITYNRSDDISNFNPQVRLSDDSLPHGAPIYYQSLLGHLTRFQLPRDRTSQRPSSYPYYFSPGIDQTLKDDYILFDRHGCTNEGFTKEEMVPYSTQNMGPDYIICRVVTPQDYNPSIIPYYIPDGKPFKSSGDPYGAMTMDSLITRPGLQGQIIRPVEDHCWWVKGHQNWVSLGDVTPANGGRKIIVEDAFNYELVKYEHNIIPGVYNS